VDAVQKPSAGNKGQAFFDGAEDSHGHLGSGHFGSMPMEAWTAEDVAAFIDAQGYANKAGNFVAQEIDGRALVLMRREDYTNLGLSLGPTLKIYEAVHAHMKHSPEVSTMDDGGDTEIEMQYEHDWKRPLEGNTASTPWRQAPLLVASSSNGDAAGLVVSHGSDSEEFASSPHVDVPPTTITSVASNTDEAVPKPKTNKNSAQTSTTTGANSD
jgi:hypothetical protein